MMGNCSSCLMYVLLLSGHLEVLKLLVARGADITCKDKKGYTLLHTAAASGQIEVVKQLLRHGVEASPVIASIQGKLWCGEASDDFSHVLNVHYHVLKCMQVQIQADWTLHVRLQKYADHSRHSSVP